VSPAFARVFEVKVIWQQLSPLSDLIEIGKPGSFDKVFGLRKYLHSAMLKDVYVVVWKDNGTQVEGSGRWLNPLEAEAYVKQNRENLIQSKMEEIVLL
jgi:hypothetical protein